LQVYFNDINIINNNTPNNNLLRGWPNVNVLISESEVFGKYINNNSIIKSINNNIANKLIRPLNKNNILN